MEDWNRVQCEKVGAECKMRVRLSSAWYKHFSGSQAVGRGPSSFSRVYSMGHITSLNVAAGIGPSASTWCLLLPYIIIIIIIIIFFMHGIYTYIPETNCVRREYSVAANLLLLFMVLISLVPVLNLLYFYIGTFRSMCAVPIWLFSVVTWLRVFLCSRIFWITLK